MGEILYAATTSAGKLRDFAAASSAYGIRILPLPGLAAAAAPVEDQPDFEGNARLKAVFYSRLLPEETVIADDSGLEVGALGGAPGVHSARYASDAGFTAGRGVDGDNNLLLLRNLEDVPREERQARYRCVLAAARGGCVLLTAEGSVEGFVLREPRGDGGFGYDPLFFLPELDRTMAEIGLAEKLALSHRGRALRALLLRLHGAEPAQAGRG